MKGMIFIFLTLLTIMWFLLAPGINNKVNSLDMFLYYSMYVTS